MGGLAQLTTDPFPDDERMTFTRGNPKNSDDLRRVGIDGAHRPPGHGAAGARRDTMFVGVSPRNDAPVVNPPADRVIDAATPSG